MACTGNTAQMTCCTENESLHPDTRRQLKSAQPERPRTLAGCDGPFHDRRSYLKSPCRSVVQSRRCITFCTVTFSTMETCSAVKMGPTSGSPLILYWTERPYPRNPHRYLRRSCQDLTGEISWLLCLDLPCTTLSIDVPPMLLSVNPSMRPNV